jgi:transposase
MSNAFLRQMSTRHPDAVHVIIWDQAGFHQNTDTSLDQLPLNVPIISLPPYNPELNPIEKLADLIGDRIGNIHYVTLTDIEATISAPPPHLARPRARSKNGISA